MNKIQLEEQLGKDLFDKMALSMYKFYWIDPAFYLIKSA